MPMLGEFEFLHLREIGGVTEELARKRAGSESSW